jgi:hypothetical protein
LTKSFTNDVRDNNSAKKVQRSLELNRDTQLASR